MHDSDVPDEVLARQDEIFVALQDGDPGTGCDPLTGAKLEPKAPPVSDSG